MTYGIVGFLILVLDIWALLGVWGSSATIVAKLVWTLIILALPLVGLILWYFIGPKGSVSV